MQRESFLERLKKKLEQARQGLHSKDESLYGHLSKIDCKEDPNLNDYIKYPNLKNAHPQHFEIKEGEALLIPKKWWHYIVTYENCYFANFWTHINIGEEPRIVKHNVKYQFGRIAKKSPKRLKRLFNNLLRMIKKRSICGR